MKRIPVGVRRKSKRLSQAASTTESAFTAGIVDVTKRHGHLHRIGIRILSFGKFFKIINRFCSVSPSQTLTQKREIVPAG